MVETTSGMFGACLDILQCLERQYNLYQINHDLKVFLFKHTNHSYVEFYSQNNVI